MHTGATELVAKIMRSLDADTWINAKWPLHLTIPLSQTCKEVRKAVHDARMYASVRVASLDSFFAARKYEIAQLRLEPLFGLSPFSGVGNSYGREALLVQELPRMSKLRRLDVCGNNMGSWAQSDSFFEALGANCTALTDLDLSENEIGFESDLGMIQAMMPLLSRLQRLNLSFNDLNNEGVLSVFRGCALCTSLTELDLSGNELCVLTDITEADFGSNLKTLKLARCDLGCVNNDGYYDTEGVAQLILNYTSLTHLDLHANHLVDAHVADLSLALSKATWLTTLNLSSNHFGDAHNADLVASWHGEQQHLLIDPVYDDDSSTVEDDSANPACTIA
jgi:hypothetical protein